MIIPAGNNNATFNVSITDDNMLEINETFELSIESTSLPRKVFASGGSINYPFKTTVYILDDDNKTLGEKLMF